MIAHTSNGAGVQHALVDHLRAVAQRAADFGGAFGAADVAQALGYWHDLGKCAMGFQDYLDRQERGIGPRGGPDHKGAGALLALEAFPDLEPLSLVIQGHHGGMYAWNGTVAERPPRFASMQEWLRDRSGSPEVAEARRTGEETIPDLLPPGPIPVPAWALSSPLAAEMFIRMCLSVVIDGDHLDTEAHFDADKAAQRPADVDVADLLDRFTAGHRALTSSATTAAAKVTRARQGWYDACLAAATGPRGFYRLPAPTGVGKTLSGMAFALWHASHHGMRRVVIGVPFTSITDQTARVYRQVFDDRDRTDDRSIPRGEGGQFILEHHSAVDPERGRNLRARLSSENWSMPIVVTTMVQLFESLFTRKPGKVRKIHRLANSVILLDEVQSLPIRLLDPILDGLAELVRHYGATVVLSTATQPAFDALEPLRDIQAIDIAPNPPVPLPARQRYTRRAQPVEWGDLAEEIDVLDQVLAVVNTRRDAANLYERVRDPGTFHLSTLQCGLHRRRVVAEVRRRLDAGERCRLISTQVVEAGVDLDFPTGYRALAPLDSIIQAGGRVNRNGRLPEGEVVVFETVDGAAPRDASYRTRIGITAAVWDGSTPPDDPGVLRRYYEMSYQDLATDRDDIQALRARLDYPAVHEKVRLIEGFSIDVLVTTYEPLPDPQWIERLNAGNAPRWMMRVMAPYIVSVPAYMVEQMTATGHLHRTDMGGEEERSESGIYVWDGDYDPDIGLVDALYTPVDER